MVDHKELESKHIQPGGYTGMLAPRLVEYLSRHRRQQWATPEERAFQRNGLPEDLRIHDSSLKKE